MTDRKLSIVEDIDFDFSNDGSFFIEFTEKLPLSEAARFVLNQCRYFLQKAVLAGEYAGTQPGHRVYHIDDSAEGQAIITIGTMSDLNRAFEIVNENATQEVLEAIHAQLTSLVSIELPKKKSSKKKPRQ